MSAPRSSVPRHGLARDRAWQLRSGLTADGAAELVATLVDASSFVCLEAAQLMPVTLMPGQTWSAAQYLLAR